MYKSLQSCRAIAAIFVVLFHLGSAIASDRFFGIKQFSIPFSFGKCGVEFFFVLSGFIIYYAHRNDISKPHKLKNYFKKRFARIYPTYWMVFWGVFFLSLFVPSLLGDVPHDFLLLIKSAVLLPQAIPLVNGKFFGAPVLGVAWTLQHEMVFYLLFSLAILNRFLGLGALLLFTGLYVYGSLMANIRFPLSFIARDYNWLFIMGMGIAIIFTSRRITVSNPIKYTITGFVIFLVTAVDVVTKNMVFNGFHTLLYGVASSLLIMGLVTAEENGKVFLGNKVFQMLGDSSYALYLLHIPIINILCNVAMLLGVKMLGFFGAVISYFIIFITCIGASAIFNSYIEKPIAIKIKSFLSSH